MSLTRDDSTARLLGWQGGREGHELSIVELKKGDHREWLRRQFLVHVTDPIRGAPMEPEMWSGSVFNHLRGNNSEPEPIPNDDRSPDVTGKSGLYPLVRKSPSFNGN